MPAGTQFDRYCARQIAAIDFFSQHCDVAVKDYYDLCAAGHLIHLFDCLESNETLLILLHKLLTPQLVNDVDNGILFYLIEHQLWNALRIVIRAIGITPDVVASMIGIHFPCLILPRDIATSLSLPNRNRQLKRLLPNMYRITANQKRYKDLLNGKTNIRLRGFVMVNIRPYLVVDSATNTHCLTKSECLNPAIELDTTALIVWIQRYLNWLYVIDRQFDTVIDWRMLVSFRHLFMKYQVIPKFQQIELDYQGDLCYFRMDPGRSGEVCLIVDCKLKQIKMLMEMLLTFGFYDEVTSPDPPKLPALNFVNDPDQHLMEVINDLWKNFLKRKREVKTLEQLCVNVIRESLSPITANKIYQAGIIGVYFRLVARQHLAETFMYIVRKHKER